MREVRMTFGEHLEELRTRILWAILWLSLAVVVSFIYGKSLLKWTMGPHEIAIRGAVRDRAASIVETKGKELLALAERGPAAEGEGSGDEASRVWSDLFAADAFQARLRAGLEARFRGWGEKAFPALSADQRKELVAGAESLGRDLAEGLSDAILAENSAVGARSLPSRFFQLEKDLRQISGRIGANPVKRMIGVGRSLSTSMEPLVEFDRFLEARREAVLRAPPPAALAPASGASGASATPAASSASSAPTSSSAAGEFIRKLEALYDDLRIQTKILGEDEAKPPIAISYLESFMTYFKVALVFGLFFATPLILYEMWKFVGAGLYTNEQRWVLIFMPFSLALFFGGALFGYFSVIPVALEFLAGWGSDMVEMSFTLSNYVGLFFTLTVLLGLVFQTPLVMVFLGKIGVLDANGFRKARKWMIFGSVLFAGVVTPPDPLSWSLVAGPMILLYELGIILVAIGARKKPGPGSPTETGTPTGATMAG